MCYLSLCYSPVTLSLLWSHPVTSSKNGDLTNAGPKLTFFFSMRAPSLWKVSSAASSSLTHRRSEADLISEQRTLCSQCLFEAEACVTFQSVIFFSFFVTSAYLWTVEWASSSRGLSNGCKWVQAGHFDPDQAPPSEYKRVASKSHLEPLHWWQTKTWGINSRNEKD